MSLNYPNGATGRGSYEKLQNALTSHIRNGGQVAYDQSGGLPIQQRRLQVYRSLFYNNLESFLGGVFPICKKVLGEEVWHQLMLDFLKNHQCKTPLFHEMGQEFLAFLKTPDEISEANRKQLHEVVLELAHYEWVELAVSIEPQSGFEIPSEPLPFNENLCYELSPLAWVLSYSAPVADISPDFLEQNPQWLAPKSLWAGEGAHCFLVFRNTEDQVEFHRLMPFLHQLLQALGQDKKSIKEHLQEMVTNMSQDNMVALVGEAEQMQVYETEEEVLQYLTQQVEPVILALQAQAIVKPTFWV